MRSPNQPPPSEVRAARNRSSSTPWRSRILPLCLRSSPPSRCSSLAPSRVCSSGWGSVWGGDPLSEGSFCAFLQCSVQEITAGRKRTRNDVTRHDAINAVLRAETIRGWVNWSTPSCGILLETWLGENGVSKSAYAAKLNIYIVFCFILRKFKGQPFFYFSWKETLDRSSGKRHVCKHLPGVKKRVKRGTPTVSALDKKAQYSHCILTTRVSPVWRSSAFLQMYLFSSRDKKMTLYAATKHKRLCLKINNKHNCKSATGERKRSCHSLIYAWTTFRLRVQNFWAVCFLYWTELLLIFAQIHQVLFHCEASCV